MEIKEMFSKEMVNFDLRAGTKNQVIDELIDMLFKNDKIFDKEEFKKAVLQREEEFSTGIGRGIAIPHGKSEAVKEASIVFGRSNKGIDYGSLDGQPAQLFFLIAVPKESNDIHLRALSTISRKLMHDEIRDGLLTVNSFQEFIEVFD